MGKERILTSRASLMEGDRVNRGDLVTLARSVLPGVGVGQPEY